MEKRSVGRPLKYTPEVLDDLALKLRQWVKDCRRKDELALLSEWAFDHDFSPFYFKRYVEKHEGFKEAYLYAKAWQEHQVAKGGLTKKLDPRFSQFFLGCQHGWRSKDDVEDKEKKQMSKLEEIANILRGDLTDDDDEEDE